MSYLMAIWKMEVCGGFRVLIGTRKDLIWS